MTLTPRKSERIATMFAKGFSLDLISEWGVTAGWTRDDAKALVEAKGWALDWDGRLQTRYLVKLKIENVPLRGGPSIAEADVERMIGVGIDHEVGEIRRLAIKAQRVIEELRRVMIIQESRDAEAVARDRAAKESLSDPERITHGSWGGYLMHRRYNIPTTPQCGCEDARDAYSPSANQAHAKVS